VPTSQKGGSNVRLEDAREGTVGGESLLLSNNVSMT